MLEFVLKVVGQGFACSKYAYMKSAWNILDFVCIIVGVMEFTPLNVDTILMIRTLRVLKPLRSIKTFPNLRKLIQCMLASLFGLLNVLLFLNFVLAFFAVLGVNLLQGSQYRACRQSNELQYITDSNGIEVPIWPKTEPFKLCNSDSDC